MDHEALGKGIRDDVVKRGIEQFEIFLIDSQSLSIEVKNQEVDSYHLSEERAISLRIIKDRRMGFSYSTRLSPDNIGKVIEDAVNGSSATARDDFYGFPGKGDRPATDLPVFDHRLSRIPKEEKIEKAIALERLTRAFDPRVKKIRKCAYNEASFIVTIMNSEGIHHSQRKSLISASVMAVAEDGKDSQSGWDFDFRYFFDQLAIEKIAAGASTRALEMLGARRSTSVKCPVVLDNLSACQFLEVLDSSFVADSVQKGKSMLRGRVGEDVFSPVLDIIDDGLYLGGIATSAFDGEGVARQSTTLVREGVLEGFLYDTYCGRKEERESTGNSSRGSFRVPPAVGVSNLFIKPGIASPDELVESLNRGILVTDVMGIHTANPVSGDFSVGMSGSWVEGGKRSFPLKGMALSGNLIDLFKKVKLSGMDLRFLGNVGSPSLLLEPMDVSGE